MVSVNCLSSNVVKMAHTIWTHQSSIPLEKWRKSRSQNAHGVRQFHRKDDLWFIHYGLLWDKNRINRDLVGSTCGLIRGKTNSIYIEYTIDNMKDKFNGKKVKKFPKKQETKDGGPLATIDICGHIPVISRLNTFHFNHLIRKLFIFRS